MDQAYHSSSDGLVSNPLRRAAPRAHTMFPTRWHETHFFSGIHHPPPFSSMYGMLRRTAAPTSSAVGACSPGPGRGRGRAWRQ